MSSRKEKVSTMRAVIVLKTFVIDEVFIPLLAVWMFPQGLSKGASSGRRRELDRRSVFGLFKCNCMTGETTYKSRTFIRFVFLILKVHLSLDWNTNIKH